VALVFGFCKRTWLFYFIFSTKSNIFLAHFFKPPGHELVLLAHLADSLFIIPLCFTRINSLKFTLVFPLAIALTNVVVHVGVDAWKAQLALDFIAVFDAVVIDADAG
jgi:hypothetical protein